MNRIYRLPLFLVFAILPFCGLFTTAAKAQTATTTVLNVNQACQTEGCVVTLTATVTAGGSAVYPGLVTFCDKGPQNCEKEAPIGRAQLTKNGTAIVRVGLSTGTHSLRAIFHGTKTYGGSSSSSHSATASAGAADRAVTSYPPTFTEANGGFQFTTNSLVVMGQEPVTGTVSFIDTTRNNLNLGSSPIVPGPVTQVFSSPNGDSEDFSFAETILTGDFNNDGFLDAVEIDNTGLLTVGLGDGNGNFKQGPDFAAQQTGDVAPSEQLPGIVGDFNSDGKLDIALPDTTSTTIRILLGNGDGTFTLAPATTVMQSSQVLVPGDFNNDGIPDLISVSTRGSAGSFLEVLLGKGDGTFTAGPVISLTNENLVWAGTGDFNGDGNQDIAFGSYTGAYVGTNGTTLTILKGNGDGSFVSTPAATYTQNLSILATGDFDGDGITDIMAAGVDPANNFEPNFVAYYHGNGDFTFSNKSTSIYSYVFPSSFIPADYLGDGTLQVSTSIQSGVDLVTGSALNGPTFVTLPLGFLTPSSSGAPAVGDFNNDGLPDVIDIFYGFDVPSTPPTVYANGFTSVASAVSPVIDLPLGNHQIATSYSGDANHDSNVSSAVDVYSSGVTYGSGFGTAPALSLNGAATLSNGAIALTNGGEFEVGTFFTNNRVEVGNGFSSSFDFQIPVGNADGFAFVVQNTGPDAAGSSGGGLGYGNPPGGTGASIIDSLALAFDTHNNQGEGANSIRLEYNGVTTGTGAIDLTGQIDLHSGHRFHVQIQSFPNYANTEFIVAITDTVTQASFQHDFIPATPAVLTGDYGYIGFTSSTGTSTGATTIYDWTLDSSGPSSGFGFPSGFTGAASSLYLNQGSAVSGSVLNLTNGTEFQATSSYSQVTVPLFVGSDWAPFSTDFDFNVGDGNGDGFTFVLQDHNTTAVGSSGGGLGYGVDYLTPAPPAYAIIPNSLAIKFDLHNNHGEGANSTGLYLNGASPTTPSVDLTPSGINLHSGHNFHANINRTGQNQFTLTLTDLNVYKVFQTTFTATDASVLQEGSAYAGFTAGTGATPSTIKILNWTVTE